MDKVVEISKVKTGRFSVAVDGVHFYDIFNGDLGSSGRGGNMYGIENIGTGKITWIGSLAKCKKTVQFWASKL